MSERAADAVAAFWLRPRPAPAISGLERPAADEADAAMARLRALPACAPTPLRVLRDHARRSGVASVWLKDESTRFGAGSFKALGAAYALARIVERTGPPAQLTVVCATDGNHGRAVAWAAQQLGARAVVFMPDHALPVRVARIRALGADVQLVAGNYDAAVDAAAAAAQQRGWSLLSDTSAAPDDPVTLDVMSGYALAADEALQQVGELPPTHVFLQAGVGTFAAAMIVDLVRRTDSATRRFVIVEPASAACVLHSLAADVPAEIGGSYASVMDCLAAGRVSAAAWPILRTHVGAAIALHDFGVTRALAEHGLALGPSGIAGLAGFDAVAQRPELRAALELDEGSRVLVFGTEEPLD